MINGSTNASGTKATFDLNIESDDIDEWDEDIVINLGNPSNGIKGGTQQHTVTITDVSTAPSIALQILVLMMVLQKRRRPIMIST